MNNTLSTKVKIKSNQEKLENLNKLTKKLTNKLLKKYWNKKTLKNIKNTQRAYKHFNEQKAFENIELYLPSRFKRCILEKVGRILKSQSARYHIFQITKNTIKQNKPINRTKKDKIKEKIKQNEKYLDFLLVDKIIKEMNKYYKKHGNHPTSFFDLQKIPKNDNNLPYSADDGKNGQMLKYKYNEKTEKLEISIKLPNTTNSKNRKNWKWHEFKTTHNYLKKLTKLGKIKAPELQTTKNKNGKIQHHLQIPIKIQKEKQYELKENKLVGIDLGIKKLATCVTLNKNNKQLSTPHFIDSKEKEKMRKLYYEKNNLNSKLENLRKHGQDHTQKFKHLQSEYKRKQNKLKNKRKQIIHKVTNKIINYTIKHKAKTIILENLKHLKTPKNKKQTSWTISTWARGDLLEKLKYKAKQLNIKIKLTNPYNTSRTCPRCGKKGTTIKAPDNKKTTKTGGHFYCPKCNYQADRDYIGALNIARSFLNNGSLKKAKPTAYMEVDNTLDYRFSSVSPTLDKSEKEEKLPSHKVSPLGTIKNSSNELQLGSKTKGMIKLIT